MKETNTLGILYIKLKDLTDKKTEYQIIIDNLQQEIMYVIAEISQKHTTLKLEEK